MSEPLTNKGCYLGPARLHVPTIQAHRCLRMKALSAPANGHAKLATAKAVRPRMTRRLAEQRAVGDRKAPKFDGVAFLRTLKK